MKEENNMEAIMASAEETKREKECCDTTQNKKCDCSEDDCKCKEIAESELRRKLDLLLRTGKILVESAADTSRIMRTMKRAAAFLGLDENTCICSSTGMY